jgi:L-ascorbate metabolism protein UlaG (beta-lactamase superfamily)
MELTFYGHGTFGGTFEGKKILIDPFFRGNPKSDVDPQTVDCEYMLITHGHGDHIADAVEIAKRCKCKVIANYEIATWLEKQGVEDCHPMNHGGQISTSWGKLKYVNAVHSSMLPDGSYGGNPGGFIFFTEGKEVYFAGDTALHMDMKLMGEYNKIDLAILPIGDNFTMGIDDAVIAADFVKCDKVLGMHYDTFGLIEIDADEAKRKFEAKGKELTLMNIGESRTF